MNDIVRDVILASSALIAACSVVTLVALHKLHRALEQHHKILRQHHDWHLGSGLIGLPDGEGGWIEIDNAAEYSDSTLCAETTKALSSR